MLKALLTCQACVLLEAVRCVRSVPAVRQTRRRLCPSMASMPVKPALQSAWSFCTGDFQAAPRLPDAAVHTPNIPPELGCRKGDCEACVDVRLHMPTLVGALLS